MSREYDAEWERVAEAIDLPGIRRVARLALKQGDGCVGEVEEFQELVGVGGRMIVDFIDDDRADAGAGVAGAQGRSQLSWELFLPVAGDVTAERRALFRRAEGKAGRVAREVACDIRGEEPERLPL